MIDYLHKNGLKVNCWTVDIKERAEELCAWGVDYITSNILESE
jgi:glycerophosphoryl diester phosphodiesterase